jgi:hypothetical protein
VTINTIVPYLYAASATTLPGSDPLNFGNSFPNTGFTVSDSDGGSPFFQTVNPGDSFGLANVSYTVSPTFSGTDTISSLGIGTSLSDINGNPISFTSMDGSISTAIPEPSTLIQAATNLFDRLGRSVAAAPAPLKAVGVWSDWTEMSESATRLSAFSHRPGWPSRHWASS